MSFLSGSWFYSRLQVNVNKKQQHRDSSSEGCGDSVHKMKNFHFHPRGKKSPPSIVRHSQNSVLLLYKFKKHTRKSHMSLLSLENLKNLFFIFHLSSKGFGFCDQKPVEMKILPKWVFCRIAARLFNLV